ncbi:MAG: hemagglutinin repeat-containing protein [Hydrogenophaga sp.]|nr:hemagglutinin repeat-containing protein [Hydrogenophaga sp.]
MNRQQHRLVFNRARGALMAVGEGARSVHKSASGQGARTGVVAAAMALLCSPGVATAQIVADPGAPGPQRPTVLAAPNGVPLVNIQTPSAAGVSRNTYQRFDVDGQGAILNNSRTDAPTRLGGWVPGNPWLAGGAARVILNEVNSTNPSHLNGWVEVAGQRAEVVIANPAGIRVNGAGFINASGVTLTTGTPVFNGGALDTYLVQRGQISIDGAGLDARDADHAAVLARSVQLNAGLWATRLNVVTGASTVDAARHTPAGPATPNGATPAFALDVAQLGGMYAGHIHLVGTEAGLGVNSRGVIAAESGRLTLDTRGQLVNQGALLAAGDMTLQAAQLVNDAGAPTPTTAPAVIAAGGALTVRADTLDNRNGALIHSEGDMVIAGAIDSAGPARAVNNLSATIEAQDNLVLSTQSLRNERSNINVTQVGVLDQTARLDMPSWWVNGRNEHGAPITATSNYTPYHYYLLNPASILSEQTLITPDGNRIQRIEVALDPSDSIHHAAAGAYGGQYGVRSRLNVGAPTTAVLYVQQRVDGVANPDQVSGSRDVFAAQTAEVHTWQQNTLDYSNAYGRCSTNCTLLVVQPGYGNPLSDLLRSDQTHLVPTHAGLELSRTARHTAQEDRLNPDAGASAALRAGGAMRLDIGESLVNRHADILAGTTLDVIAPEASVTNQGRTLYRRHHFAITSRTAALGDFDWTRPGINEVLGQLGGRISAGQQLNLQARSFSNIDPGPGSGPGAEPLGSGLQFAGVSFPGAGAPLVMANHSLFRPAPPQRSYLVETDPRFTQHRAWLGSDYLLDRLADGHDLTLKRLGDGWHEQKLVREQVAELTGLRLLEGFSSDEAQLRALMDAGIAQAQTLQLRAGVALSAAQVAQLSTDLVWLVQREVLLPDGSTTQALVPQVYLRSVPRDELLPSGALLAGRQVSLQVAQDLVNAGGRIEGDVVLAQAGRDLVNVGGLMQARSELLAQAGRDVTISSPTHTTTFASRHVTQSHTALAGVGAMRVTGTGSTDDDAGGGGRLTIQAGQDVVLQGARVSNAGAGGSTTMQAGRDVQLQTMSVGSENSVVADARNHRHNSERREIGSDIAVQGKLDIRAGQDVMARAASVQAQGTLSVQASESIHLQAGRAISESASSQYQKRSGPVSSKRTEVHESAASDVTIGSRFGGADVKLQAGHDIVVQGSEVSAQHTLRLGAGRDVLIVSEENHASASYAQATKKSGLSVTKQGVDHGKSAQSSQENTRHTTQAASGISGANVHIDSGRDTTVLASTVVADEHLSIDATGDVNIVAGTHHEAREQQSHSHSSGVNVMASGLTESVNLAKSLRNNGQGTGVSATAAASTVGSLGGDVSITSGQRYQQTGSDVLAVAGDVDIAARSVTITEARELRGTADQRSGKSTVFGATPRNALVDAIKGAKNTLDTAEATARTGDSRLQAIGAAATALQAANTAGQMAALVADPTKIASVTIDFNLGSNKHRSDSTETRDTGRASAVTGAGDVRIAASGLGKDSDLLVRGSDVRAGGDALIQAEGDVRLESAQERAALRERSNSSGASIGVGISFGASTGITLNASANQARGNADGADVVQRNARIEAGNNPGNVARIESGADTTLAGAVVSGHAVQAEVGGDLRIESRQDTSTFKSDQQSSGFSMSLCIPPICYGASSVSASSAKQNIHSEHASVVEQSGLRAGDGGFQVKVQNNTTLAGGAIISTDQAVQDGSNRFTTGGELALSDVYNRAHHEAEGYAVNMTVAVKGAEATTPEQQAKRAAVPATNAGSAGIGEDSGQARSTTLAAISGIAGDQDARTGDAPSGIAPTFNRATVQQEIDAQIRITAEFGKSASKAIGDHAGKRFNELKDSDPEEAAKWAEGGAYRMAAHSLVGGLAGGAAGAAGAGLSSLSADAINQLTGDMPDGVRQLVGAGVAAGIGAIAGSNAGAATAFNADVNNRQLHPTERQLARELARKSGGKYTAEQIEEQMRLMGNRVHHAQPNTTEVLTDTNAIVDHLDKDPGMPKISDGRTVVEIPGQTNADIQRFIIGNTTDNADYIPGVSPYMSSQVNGQSAQSGPTTATATARCANGDLACISGVGVQQSSLPELGDAARNAIADGAASTSRAAGVVAAGATAAVATSSPHIKPIASAIAVGATVAGVAADAVEQAVRPSVGQALQDAMLTSFQEWADRKIPGVAPVTNEVIEAWRASGTSKSVETWANEKWKAFLERTSK